MVLDWLQAPLYGGSPNLRDLIARKKYAKAIEVLRAQLEGRIAPGPQMRLQLADLLVLAGRGNEAVPILIGLADEFARDGFVAKAVAILKRVDRVEPGRAEIEERLVSLVRQQQRDAVTAALGRAGLAPPSLGIEETAPGTSAAAPPGESTSLPVAEAAAAEAETAAPPPAEAPPTQEGAAPSEPAPVSGGEAHPTEAEGSQSVVGRIRGAFQRFLASQPSEAADPSDASADTAAAVDAEGLQVSLDPVEVPSVAAEAATFVESEAEPVIELEPLAAEEAEARLVEAGPAVVSPAGPGVTGRIRSVFKRFLAALPGHPSEHPDPEPTAPDVDQAQTDLAQLPPLEVENVGDDLIASSEVVVLPDSVLALDDGALGGEAPVVTAPLEEPPTELSADAIVGDEAAPMSEEVFDDHVLDLIEDVLQRPGAPTPEEAAPALAPDPGVPAPALVVPKLASRLLASPLFGDLSEHELLAVIHELGLLTCEAGDVVVTEGEPGDSLFIITTGTVKVFVRNPDGRNFVVGRLAEGDFFGEISSLSGRRRTATITAATRCELLSLEKKAVDAIARTHPRVRDVLESRYIQRASSPEAAAVRAVPLGDAATRERAIEILEAHFGESRWDPRMRLRLADLLLKAGKGEDAVPILVGLADDLARQGFPEKAIAILKKIERIRRRDVEEVELAPLRPGAGRRGTSRPPATAARGEAGAAPAGPASRKTRPQTAGFFEDWIVDVVRASVRRRAVAPTRGAHREERRVVDAAALEAYGRGLRASPLFVDFSEDELLALIEGLRLSTYDPGDVILTEGEPGRSVFMLAGGTVRVFVRDRARHDVALCDLKGGSFFGEIAALSGRPRSATVVAATRCELLELDKPTLDVISLAHPRIRIVLEDFYIARAGSQEAESIRTTPGSLSR